MKGDCDSLTGSHLICSLIIKITRISAYENDPDVVFVTETWTSSDTLDSELCMTGYELYRFDRRHRRGGGCIIYAKNDLNVVKIDIDIFDTESIWCKIVARKEEVVIGVSYNSPSSSDTCRNNLNNIVKIYVALTRTWYYVVILITRA